MALVAGVNSEPLPLILQPVAALRGIVRFALLLALIVAAWAGYWLTVRRRTVGKAAARAAWLSRLNRRVARLVGVHLEIHGELPTHGLIVANHLSYLDIILLSALLRPIFVSKSEVADWPFFGLCAKCGGTIFIDRQRRGAVAPAVEEMRTALAAGVPLVLFPEGTSSGGETVLPFKPSLFAIVAELGCPVTACGLDYTLPGGSVSDEVCYWGEHHFAPHLLNLFSKPGLTLRAAFGPPRVRTGDRKAIARELHAEVVALRR